MTDVAVQSLLYAAREGLRRMRELSVLSRADDRRRDQHLTNLGTEAESVSQTLGKLSLYIDELPDEAREPDRPEADPELLAAAQLLRAIGAGVATRCSCGRWKVVSEDRPRVKHEAYPSAAAKAHRAEEGHHD